MWIIQVYCGGIWQFIQKERANVCFYQMIGTSSVPNSWIFSEIISYVNITIIFLWTFNKIKITLAKFQTRYDTQTVKGLTSLCIIETRLRTPLAHNSTQRLRGATIAPRYAETRVSQTDKKTILTLAALGQRIKTK